MLEVIIILGAMAAVWILHQSIALGHRDHGDEEPWDLPNPWRKGS